MQRTNVQRKTTGITAPPPTRATVQALAHRITRRATLEARITRVTGAMSLYHQQYASQLLVTGVHDRKLMDRQARCSKVLEQLYLAWYRL